MIKQGDKIVLLSFDTESDIGSWTQDYTSIDLAMPKILDLLDRHGIACTFYWEGRAALHNPDMVGETSRRGHDCGCHTYQHETVGRPAYFIPGDRAILEDELAGRLEKNKTIVQRYAGREPVSFRAPRLWGDEILISELNRLGFHSDSSYQLTGERSNPFFYHPSHKGLGDEGDLAILELPVMALFGDMVKQAPEAVRAFGVETTGGTELIGQWPVMRLYGGQAFVDYSEPFLTYQMRQRGYNVISIYLHPWEFIPMSGVLDGPEATCHLRHTLYENTGDFAMRALDDMIRIFKDKEFTFLTADAFTALVKEEVSV